MLFEATRCGVLVTAALGNGCRKCGQSWLQVWPWRCKGWDWETQMWKHSEMYLHGTWDSQYPLGGEFSFRVRVFKYSELPGPTWLPCLLNKMPTLIKKLHEDFAGNRVKKNPSANAGDRGPCLLWEDSRCQGTRKPLSHDYWGLCVLGPAHLKPTSNVLQLLKLSTRESARCSYWDPWRALGPMLGNNRSRHNEKPREHNLRVDPTHHKEEKAQWSKMQCSQT